MSNEPSAPDVVPQYAVNPEKRKAFLAWKRKQAREVYTPRVSGTLGMTGGEE